LKVQAEVPMVCARTESLGRRLREHDVESDEGFRVHARVCLLA